MPAASQPNTSQAQAGLVERRPRPPAPDPPQAKHNQGRHLVAHQAVSGLRAQMRVE